MSDFVLVTGGARSGKSRFAELLAQNTYQAVTYIATAQIWDNEMAKRVEKHRLSRPQEWSLIEEPYDITQVLFQLTNQNSVVLLDCITLWLSNLLLRKTSQYQDWERDSSQVDNIEREIIEDVHKLVLAANQIPPKVIFVTNEVGQGIVPDNPLSRVYRDLAGKTNQILAEAAEEVYLVVAGYPIEIKQAGNRILSSLKDTGG